MKTLAELLKEKEELRAKIAGAKTDAELAELRLALNKLNVEIGEKRAEETEKEQRAAQDAREAERRAARPPQGSAPADGKTNPDPMAASFEQGTPNGAKRSAEEETREKVEKRAKALRDGQTARYEMRAVTSAQTALKTTVSGTINPAFEQVGTLDGLVNVTELPGGESYKKAFIKTYGTGGITAEGAAAATAEPSFGYAEINKIKITAYAEITEEVLKLPDARYDAEVEKAVVGAFRKKLADQIVNGTGTSQMFGIVNTPADIMTAATTLTIAAIDENALDNFLYDYGGDENVEGDAYIIMNKLTLKEFAKVKGADKKKAYDIVLRGNTGTINTIPFVLTSRVAPFATVAAGAPYMLYGKLAGYELAYFSDVEVTRSTDYKFKEGMIAYKVSGMVGGSVAMYNGFLLIIKAVPSGG
jgi:HK97 family phage major capsid protein